MPQSLQIALNLSSNQFEGVLPDTLSQLNGLEVLDLPNNSFTGQIPDSFVTMESLTQLVLSNNRLSGLIPKFRSYVSVDTTVPIGGVVFAIFIAAVLVRWISSRPNKNNDEQIESEEHRSNINGNEDFYVLVEI
ncbi:leucine-rich repeat protein 2-like [Rhododendron vialii]|uniref:leucine-rich repeat protein 2-like n=1 Tax=Rhododendron vialii TaxID=182163 RepID=UPI00265EBCC3|nr:leucine-rich repeat protein 2-like [Rhododendron vialii]